MQISTKGKYAVRIMLDVAKYSAGGAVRTQDISERQSISVKYAEQITALLVKGGLLRSARGAGGGYTLVKRADEYKISEILLKTEGELMPVDCVTDSCPKSGGCAVQSLWSGLYKAVHDYLDSVTLQNLLDSSSDGGDNYVI